MPAAAIPARIFHICTRAAALQAQTDGRYSPESLATEGFIHLSQAHQVQGVLARFYAGVPDLVVLVVDTGRLLHAPLRFEPPAPMPGATEDASAPAPGLFPHLYGPLDMEAVLQVVDAATFDPALFALGGGTQPDKKTSAGAD